MEIELPTYEPNIGLEVHAELSTRTKVFCGCATAVGAPPNSQVCPVCLGFPGVLPVLNRRVVEYALRMALALNCEITRPSIFERKGYYYPDLPKNFQISQKRAPLGRNGYLDLSMNGEVRRIGITDVHIEEDAAKLLHPGESKEETLVDFNRSGIPLLEIVSEPDMRSVAEAEAYMNAIRSTLLYLGISEARMEQGQLRFEASVSLRPVGSEKLGTRVEIKNLNSFRAVSQSVAHEIARQSRALESGESVIQETRLWDDERGLTEPMRRKETAMDYRYFPEPDLAPLVIDEAWIERVRAKLPELAEARRRRFVRDYGFSDKDAETLTTDKSVADAVETAIKAKEVPAEVAKNFMMGPGLRWRHDRVAQFTGQLPERMSTPDFEAETMSGLYRLQQAGQLSGTAARAAYPQILDSGKTVEEFVKEHGTQISDEEQLAATVDAVIAENADAAANFRAGNEKSLGFLVGQVMRKSGKRANPQLANKLLRDRLSR